MFRTVSFAPCQTYSCETITITSDPVVENRESFTVTLERTSDLDNRITLSPVNASVVINDSDGMLCKMLFRLVCSQGIAT